MAVPDREEFIFIDSQNKAGVELAWQHFRPQERTALGECLPFVGVHYLPQAAETMKRLPGEFHLTLHVLAARDCLHETASVLLLTVRKTD